MTICATRIRIAFALKSPTPLLLHIKTAYLKRESGAKNPQQYISAKDISLPYSSPHLS